MSETPDQAKLEVLVDRLTRRGIEITRMDTKIAMSLETEEEIQTDTESALSFQNNISYWQFKIAHLKSKQDIPVSQLQYSNSKQTPTARMHVNLPKININSFRGYPLEWLTFRDSFSASVAIDKNLQLGDVEKMNYLKGMLTGGAASAISGLPLTKENYKKAVDLLKVRFGKTQVFINAYMESLSKINAPSNETKIGEYFMTLSRAENIKSEYKSIKCKKRI